MAVKFAASGEINLGGLSEGWATLGGNVTTAAGALVAPGAYHYVHDGTGSGNDTRLVTAKFTTGGTCTSWKPSVVFKITSLDTVEATILTLDLSGVTAFGWYVKAVKVGTQYYLRLYRGAVQKGSDVEIALNTAYRTELYVNDSDTVGEYNWWLAEGVGAGVSKSSGALNSYGNTEATLTIGQYTKDTDFKIDFQTDHIILVNGQTGYATVAETKTLLVSGEGVPQSEGTDDDFTDQAGGASTYEDVDDGLIAPDDATTYAKNAGVSVEDKSQTWHYPAATSMGAAADDRVIGIVVYTRGQYYVTGAKTSTSYLRTRYSGSLDDQTATVPSPWGWVVAGASLFAQAPGAVDWTQAVFNATEFGWRINITYLDPDVTMQNQITCQAVLAVLEIGGEPPAAETVTPSTPGAECGFVGLGMGVF